MPSISHASLLYVINGKSNLFLTVARNLNQPVYYIGHKNVKHNVCRQEASIAPLTLQVNADAAEKCIGIVDGAKQAHSGRCSLVHDVAPRVLDISGQIIAASLVLGGTGKLNLQLFN